MKLLEYAESYMIEKKLEVRNYFKIRFTVRGITEFQAESGNISALDFPYVFTPCRDLTYGSGMTYILVVP